MNYKQQEFLNSLHTLFEKYAVECVRVKDNEVEFVSGDDVLAFSLYENDTFSCIRTMSGLYSPSLARLDGR